MTSNIPLISILIATKNRIPFCVSSIKSILNFNEPNFELIIQDNSDTTQLCNFVRDNFNDSRLIYNYTPPPYSSIDNFNAVMRLARGEYVCLIGDDDGINPEIFDVVCWAKKNGIDSICPTVYASYLWPNTLPQYETGHLSIIKFTSEISSSKPKDKLLPLLKHGIINYMNFKLPKVYHGIVKRDCFEQIYRQTGFYFGGLSPDIYSAVALSSIVKNHFTIDYPLTISGACNSSTTVDNLKGAHAGVLEKAPHFRDRKDYLWDSNIPKYYSVQTIWAESAFKAIKELNIEVNLRKFNLARMVSISFLYNKNIFRLIFTETNKHLKGKSSKLKFYLKVLFYLMQEIAAKITNKLLRKSSETYFLQLSNIEDIENATKITIDKLKVENEIGIKKKLKL